MKQKILGFVNFCRQIIISTSIRMQLLDQCAVCRHDVVVTGVIFEAEQSEGFRSVQARGVSVG
jgi:hypothetical protein